MIVASDVPMATCIATEASTLKTLNTANSIGTTTKPPPIPKRPAIKPAARPAAINTPAS